MQIIQSGLRPSIILTTDEERGGLGAKALSKRECPIPQLKYMIELDRQGSCDCVFYDCMNPDFIQYIEKFGFIERVGSFSDISFLMPAWKTCGTNLSVGYKNEHTISEILNVNALYRTINTVKEMLQEKEIPHFEYREIGDKLSNYYQATTPYNYENDYDMGAPCEHCGKYFFDFELIPVKGHKTKKKKYYCSDCVVDRVNWCDNCGQAYEIGDPDEDIELCLDCMEALTSDTNN